MSEFQKNEFLPYFTWDEKKTLTLNALLVKIFLDCKT